MISCCLGGGGGMGRGNRKGRSRRTGDRWNGDREVDRTEEPRPWFTRARPCFCPRDPDGGRGTDGTGPRGRPDRGAPTLIPRTHDHDFTRGIQTGTDRTGPRRPDLCSARARPHFVPRDPDGGRWNGTVRSTGPRRPDLGSTRARPCFWPRDPDGGRWNGTERSTGPRSPDNGWPQGTPNNGWPQGETGNPSLDASPRPLTRRHDRSCSMHNAHPMHAEH